MRRSLSEAEYVDAIASEITTSFLLHTSEAPVPGLAVSSVVPPQVVTGPAGVMDAIRVETEIEDVLAAWHPLLSVYVAVTV